MANSTSFVCKLHREAMQSVMPTMATDPRESFRLILPQNLSSATIFRRRFHVVLFYNKACDEDSGWLFAGWIKESLGEALVEQPKFAGRLRQSEESGADMQIVSNDCGVRLVESRAEMKLADFLELNTKREAEAEAELVFWDDLIEHNPQFSPLFYVQVTNFTCGGYSIGISCSFLLADPFFMTSFLKRWANIHSNMVSKTNLPKIPIFYTPNLAKSCTSPTQTMGSNTGKNAAECVIFKLPTKISNTDNNIHKNLAALCINEAEQEIGRKMASKFCLFTKFPSEDAKVEICSRQGLLEDKSSKINGLSCARKWEELGLENICFNDGNKPAYVSCWINSVVDEGSVMIIPSDDVNTSELKIVVAFN